MIIEKMRKNHISVLVFAAMGCFIIGQVGANIHIVGKSFGWNIPQNATYYQDWAANRTFIVGDSLVFLYSSGMHNVLEVKREDYDGCSEKDIIRLHFSGPSIIKLVKPGEHYFICGLRQHCEAGQKLSVKVTEPESPPLSSSSTSYSPNFTLLLASLTFLLFVFFSNGPSLRIPRLGSQLN